jgi:hypothetical protein
MTLLIDLVDQVRGLSGAGEFQTMAERLRGHAEPAFAPGAPIDELRAAVAASRAAAELEIGARALAGVSTAVSEDAARLLANIGHLQSINAEARLAMYAIPAQFAAPGDGLSGPAPDNPAQLEDIAVTDRGDFATLRNIAAYHREHARFHAHYWMARGAELVHEASKIKLIGDHWLAGGGAKPDAGIDYTDIRFRAAPCTDLNVFQAIHDIGILFLEGANEPPEIGLLKIRLGDLAAETGENGRFLATMMGGAWARESMMLAPDLIEAAWPRLQVVASNWRSALGMVVMGRLLDGVLVRLGAIDFAPAAVRADIGGAGARLRDAGWALDMAAKISAETGSFMADNDWRYANYSAFLEGRGRI